jgi:Tfp pilus assembly protein PilN
MRAVNLIPAEERGGSGIAVGRSGGSVYAVFGLIAGLAVLALLYGVSAHQVSSRQAEVASLNAKAQQAQARAAALTPYTSFVAMREQRVQAVDTLVNSRFDWAHAFHELGRVLPSNVSLTSLTGTVGSTSSASSSSAGSSAKTSATASSSPVSSATPPGSVPTFTIAGCTTSQAQVALVIDRLRLIDGVSEVTLQSSTKSGSSGGGGSAGTGGCGGSDAVFNMTVTFDALPSIPASGPSSTTTTVAASTSGTPSSTGAPR